MSRAVHFVQERASVLILLVGILVIVPMAACKADSGSGPSVRGADPATPEATPKIYPTGAVALTFDDAYIEDWFASREILAGYGATATFFVTRFNGLTEEQVEMLRKLQEDGHEIASHGLRHLGVVRDFASDPAKVERYFEEEVLPSLSAMEHNGFRPETFAYPFGERNAVYDEALLTRFSMLRGTAYPRDGLPVQEWDEIFFGCGHRDRVVYGVGIDESYDHSVESLVDGFKRAAERDEVMVLYGHGISDSGEEYRTSISRLEELLRTATGLGLEFLTVSELQSIDFESCTSQTQIAS